MAQAAKMPKQRPVTTRPADDKKSNYDGFLLAGILALTAIVFSNSVTNYFIINWDDDGYIINNPLIKEFSLQGIKTIFTVPHLDNYHPLTTLSNAIELYLFGLNPTPFHFFNLVFHVINTYLVFRFVKQLSGRIEVAAITSLFFGIHPMHVESVSWIAERKDLLYSMFYLGALIYYLRYLDGKKNSHYAVALGLFLCSLLSKPAAVVLSPVLLLVDYYKGRKMDVRVILEKVPFFVLSVFFGILAIKIQQASGSTNLAPHYELVDRIFLASYALVFYLIKAVAPFGLSAMHLYPVHHGLTWPYYCAPGVLVLMALGIWRAKGMRKELVFGSLFFLTNLLLVIQLIPVGRAIVGERYTYIPYIGLFFILGHFYCVVTDSSSRWNATLKPYIKPVLIGFGVLCLVLTWTRNEDWKDSNTLFSKAIATDPDDYYGYYARAAGAILMEDKVQALADLNMVVKLNPAYADGYYSRGVLKEKTNAAEAMADYTAAIKAKPDHARAYYNRGNLKIYANDFAGAEHDYDSAIKYDPKYAEAYCNRGATKVNTNRPKEAIMDYDAALKINADLANAYYNRGSAAYTLGDKTKACDDWHKALQLGYTAAQQDINMKCK